jgi:hypothetical protein
VPNTIRIKRSTATAAPSTLANAELAYSENSSKLFIGVGTGGAGGSATSVVAIGGSGAYITLDTSQTISGNKTFTGTVDLSSATIASFSTTGNITVGGDLTVNGTTTTINSTTITVDDKNIVLGDTASPTDAGADGGGITLKGTTDKTFNWVDATDAWTSSEHLNLASGKAFYINGTSVLSGSTLGSGVTSSSLTSVGTIGTGVWQGTAISVAYGGTGATSLTGYVKGSGTAALTASATIPNTDISGLGTLSTQDAINVTITGGSITNLTTFDGITVDCGTF